MNVLLVRPPRRNARDFGLCVPPLGLGYIASALRNAGHRVSILDAYAKRWSWGRFQRAVAQAKPDVVGMTAMTPIADVIAKAVDCVRPYTHKIVIGGPHPTAVGEKIFIEMPTIDASVVGEGEEVAQQLLAWWAGGSIGVPPAGVWVKGHTFRAAAPPSIDSIAFPARDLLPNEKYRYLFSTRRGFGTMISSRGCPFRCTFCDKSVSGSRWRARSAIDVVDEMEQMHNQHGIQFINFYDDNFLLHRHRVTQICHEILRRKLAIEWKCEGRVDSVDLPLLQLMRRAGCRVIAYGVESGNAASLAFLRKDITIEQTRRAFALTKESKIRSLAYMILGVPGEDYQQAQNSIAFCREIGADYVQFSSLSAMPGTPLTAMGYQPQSAVNPLDADLDRQTISDLSPPELEKLLRQAWTQFYIRPKAISRLGIDAFNSGSLSELVRMGTALVRWSFDSRSPS